MSPLSWEDHKKGKTHIRKAKSLGVSIEVEPETDLPAEIQRTHQFCPICQVYVDHHSWPVHANGLWHKLREKYTAYNMVQYEAEKDKNDVGIRCDLDLSIVEPSAAKQESPNIGSSRKRIQSPFTVLIEGENRRVSTLHPIKITVTFKQEYIGRYQDRLEVQFEDAALKKRFLISRMAQAIVGDPSMHDQMKPRTPYVPRVRAPREPETKVVEGTAPPSLNAIPYVSRLPKADIPKHLLSALTVFSTPSKENIQSIVRAFLPKVLDADSHGRHLKILLWIEEYKVEYGFLSFIHRLTSYGLVQARS
ncbi:hypothetical protein P691DRAFT_838726 [Macrolepiota fuliginosa MF-IS2]|uniref:U1-type domain-containing protein n=1 Tax=Macrolepiota fuliginosa MF-IS2 TaxID=1400762 RepID=A0A9P5X7B7_9AGAR|nr:hypothetical protein P691DRAFT_838726 [Macrolepiota fuliginosa MF-IS2]